MSHSDIAGGFPFFGGCFNNLAFCVAVLLVIQCCLGGFNGFGGCR